jgi:predicted MPP superfamily phosphohydrolase
MMTLVPILMLVAQLYVFWRLWHLIPVVPSVRPLLVILGVITLGSAFVALRWGDKLPTGVTAFLYLLGTSWFFILLYLLMAFLAVDILRLFGVPLARWLFDSWSGFGVLAAVMALIFTGGYLNYRNKKRVELRIELPESQRLERPLKIVAISDLHLGYTIGRREFAGWVERINAERPDLILIAGDVLDNRVRPVFEADLPTAFRQIRATHGVYAAPGNHEYIGGIGQALDFLQASGVRVLRDSVAEVAGGLYLVGRDDRSNRRRKTLESLLQGVDAARPILLLDHQPYGLEEAEKNEVTLQFSGHTHHGQVWPISLITNALFEDAYGYRKKGGTHFYVTSGLGIWGGKFRIGTRSEYVVILLE